METLNLQQVQNQVLVPVQNEPSKKKKKSKKSKKKFSFKKFLKNAMKSKKTEEEKMEIHKQKIKDSLGGGKFQKIDVI